MELPWAVLMSDTWRQWEGQIVDGDLPLLQYLGGSSGSAVFLTADPTSPQTKVVIKLLPGFPEEAAAACLTQWKLASQLSHPNLIRLYRAGRCEVANVAALYVVMEAAEEDLAQLLPHRALTPEEVREMLVPVLSALSYLHGKGLAHGGVKPSNIMALGNDVKLSSDRIARIGEPRLPHEGQNPYDPPEAQRGVISPPGGLSSASDIWSLGMTCVEVLTQTLPQRTAQGDMALPPSLPPLFTEIASHCLCIEPQRRWTLAQIAARLADPALAIPAAVPSTPRPKAAVAARRPAKKRGYLLPVIGAAAVVAAIVVGPRLLRRNRDLPEAAQDNAPQQTLPAGPAQVSESAEAPPNAPSSVALSPSVIPNSPAIVPTSTPPPSAPAAIPPSSSDSVLQKIMPQVSQSARDTIQGTIRVVIRVRVDASGNIADATFDNHGPSGYFADRAMAAAQQWKFAPAATGEWLLRFEFAQAATNAVAEPATH